MNALRNQLNSTYWKKLSKKLKILFIGGDHPRHLYYLNSIHESFSVIGCVIEKRANGTNEKNPIPPSDISEHDKKNFLKHFLNRQNTEEKFYEEIYFYQGGIKEYVTYMNSEKDALHPDIIYRIIPQALLMTL